MTLVGDRERERAAVALRRHYVAGRLDDGELSERLDAVLSARNSWDLAYALRRLPRFENVGLRVRHGLVVAAAVFVWLMMSAAIFVAFVVWMIAQGASLAALLAFPAIWLGLTALLYRRTAVSGRRLRGP